MSSQMQRIYGGRPVARPSRVSDREWRAFQRHVGAGETFGEIGADLGISAGRTGQLIHEVAWRIERDQETCPHCHGTGRIPRMLK